MQKYQFLLGSFCQKFEKHQIAVLDCESESDFPTKTGGGMM